MRAVVALIRWFALLTLALAACGDPAARVRLEPIDLGMCGKPNRAEVTRFEVIAYGATMETPKTIPVGASGAVLPIATSPPLLPTTSTPSCSVSAGNASMSSGGTLRRSSPPAV